MFKIISKTIAFINEFIAAIGIAAGVAISFINVVARYAFDASFTWASELSIYMFLWSAFFAAAYCFRKDAHIAVTIVLDLMPAKIAKIMSIISHFITIIFLLAISYYGYEYLILVAEIDERSIDLWDIPMWTIYLVIPISFFFAAFRVMQKMIWIIKTPQEEIIRKTEEELKLHGIGGDIKQDKDLEEILKEAKNKTGGLL